MSVEDYAALCAELAAFPRHAEAIRARYGVTTSDEAQALQGSWRARLAREPELLDRWAAAGPGVEGEAHWVAPVPAQKQRCSTTLSRPSMMVSFDRGGALRLRR